MTDEPLKNGRIAPTYSFSDNLAGRDRIQPHRYTGVANMDEVELFAVEAMFTF